MKKKKVQAGWNGWRRMPGVICDMRIPAREGVQGFSETSKVIRAGDGGTNEKTENGAGGGRVEDAKVFVRSDNNGQDQE